MRWLEGTLLGPVATVLAVIAVASVGFLMLTGRTDIRRGARVILGCFILFGASSIAAGIHSAAAGLDAGEAPASSDPQPYYEPAPPPAYPEAAPSAYDPYAGAAIAPRS
jgi:hypothetical protein